MANALQRLQRVQRTVDGLRKLAPPPPPDQSPSTDLARFRDDPVGLALAVFGLRLEFEGYTRQAELVRAVAAHPRVACRSGHKTGKTLAIALLAWWFGLTRPGVRVICTHPTARQVKQTIWVEIRRLRSMAMARGIELPAVPLDPATGISFPSGSQILGFTVDDPDAFSGISAPEVLYLVDEASGVADAVFEAIAGNRAGGGKLVETGNPTTTSGHFFDSFHDKRHLFAPDALLHISSLESPNVTSGRTIVPGLATAEYAEEMAAEYGGPGEPVWDVRVGGDFPRAGPNVVIPLHALEMALDRWRSGDRDTGALALGVDVARFGDDDTVIAGVRGRMGRIVATIHGAPIPAVAGQVVEAVRELRRVPQETVTIGIDEGSMGGGVVDLLHVAFEDDPHISVVGIYAAQSADDDVKFERARDEMWWLTREWLIGGATLEPHRILERELVAPTYSLTPAGKIKIESQESIKKRIKRSPDHANALGLALATVGLSAQQLTDETLPSLEFASRWEGMGGRGF